MPDNITVRLVLPYGGQLIIEFDETEVIRHNFDQEDVNASMIKAIEIMLLAIGYKLNYGTLYQDDALIVAKFKKEKIGDKE